MKNNNRKARKLLATMLAVLIAISALYNPLVANAETGTADPTSYTEAVQATSGNTTQTSVTTGGAIGITSIPYNGHIDYIFENQEYSLPKTLTANMENGGIQEVPVVWSPSIVDMSKRGQQTFTGTIEGYNGVIHLLVFVDDSVSYFATRPVTIPQNSTYTLPTTANPVMVTGYMSFSGYDVSWENPETIKTDKVGVYTIEGTVKGFKEKAKFTVTVVPEFTIDDIRTSVKLGEPYALPTTVQANFYDGTCKYVPVVWDVNSVDTSIGGLKTIEGTVDGYEGKARLLLFVSAQGLVYIPDANLESYVREAISKPTGDILESDMLNLRLIYAKGRHIKSIEGLQYAKNVNTIYLTSNNISDISALKDLENLEDLYLNANDIYDLTPLKNLPKLRRIVLDSNKVTDLTPLKGLTSLYYLDASRNPIVDISPLKELKDTLGSLTISSCKVEDISSLSGFTKLSSLSLGDNYVKDLAPLSTVINLADLNLENNSIEDFLPIVSLTKLRTLNLKGNPIADYSCCNLLDDNIVCNLWGFSMTKQDLNAFIAKADQIVASVVKPDMSTLDKEKAIHDYICTNTKYTLGVQTGAYGVLFDGKGACDAISDAVTLLMKRAGIECIKITHGWAGQAHAWNMVKINGNYYHLDCTWDTCDSEGRSEISYKYFNVSDEYLINEGRKWDMVKYPKTSNSAEKIVSLVNDTLSEQTYQNISYSLPEIVKVNMLDGSIKDVPVIWSPSTIDFSNTGDYTFMGTIEGFEGKVTLNLKVYASIQGFSAAPVTIAKNGSYELPDSVYPVLSDGTTAMLAYNDITWDNVSSIKTDTNGTYTIEGTVKGFEQKASFTVNVVPKYSIEAINATVTQGVQYTLPATIKAQVYDGTVADVPVVWDVASVDTSTIGIQTIEGIVDDYDGKVTLLLTVKAVGVNIPDPNLEQAIRTELSKPTGDILESDMLKLRSLYAKYKNISSLEGLQYAKNLISICITGNSVNDISPLKDLKSLIIVSLNYNNISDITALKDLTKIQILNLDTNNISDISPLKGLINLTSLDVPRNPLSDISSLRDLGGNLESLNLCSCRIVDISALSGFTRLKDLYLGYNKVKVVTPLSSVNSLEDLSLNNNAIEDISPLLNLANLKELNIRINPITDRSLIELFNDNIVLTY